nr:DUF5133 domain-containing protein [Streptomyces griseus]
MLMPHPTILRGLVERYAELSEDPGRAGALEDISYTLCVSTGTRTVEDALAVAESYLDEVRADGTPAGQPLAGDAADPGTVILTA